MSFLEEMKQKGKALGIEGIDLDLSQDSEGFSPEEAEAAVVTSSTEDLAKEISEFTRGQGALQFRMWRQGGSIYTRVSLTDTNQRRDFRMDWVRQ